MTTREKYMARKLTGACPDCDVTLPADCMTIRCPACHQRKLALWRKWAEARQARGVCQRCDALVVPGLVRCAECREGNNEACRIKRAALRESA